MLPGSHSTPSAEEQLTWDLAVALVPDPCLHHKLQVNLVSPLTGARGEFLKCPVRFAPSIIFLVPTAQIQL